MDRDTDCTVSAYRSVQKPVYFLAYINRNVQHSTEKYKLLAEEIKPVLKFSNIDGSTGIVKMRGALVITKETYMNIITAGK